MEARVKKYRQLSPERAKVWTEKSPKYHQHRKVPVVYYLCRNRQLEHPHFMEVPVSSPDGLCLRDVIGKLDTLRGRGMAAMYSWSCKRSYKSGFVWHDLSEDDIILPAHGSEYVLKGSELFHESNSDGFSPNDNVKTQSLKRLPEPVSRRSHDEASSSSSMNEKETRNSQEDDDPSPGKRAGSSDDSPASRAGKSDSPSSHLIDNKLYKNDGFADASTQTDDNISGPEIQKTCTRGVSTEDGSLESEIQETCQPQLPQVKDNSEICCDTVSPRLSISSPSSSGGKTETLESLIRADASKMNSFRILQGESTAMQTNTRMKGSNMLMQLISCGSLSVKNHSLDLIPSSYKARFSHSKFSSPFFSTSGMLGEFDYLAENPKAMGLRLEDKECYSGSLVESKMLKEEDGHNVRTRSSSFSAERTQELKSQDIVESSSSRNILRLVKTSLTKQPPSESMRSPVSDGSRRNSMDRDSVSGKRTNEPSSRKNQSKRVDSFREEEKVIRIEERLASGARVIIQSKTIS